MLFGGASFRISDPKRGYELVDGGTMINRRAFTTGIGALAIAGLAQTTEIDEDEAVRDILRRRVEAEKRTVGMAVCVVTPNRKRFVSYGRERLGDLRPVTSETVFEIGSITKVFTALLLADMVRRGEVGLDDPVARHLPGDYRLPELDGRQITLADLATHTSGLPSWPTFPGTPLSPSWLDSMRGSVRRTSRLGWQTSIRSRVLRQPPGGGTPTPATLCSAWRWPIAAVNLSRPCCRRV